MYRAGLENLLGLRARGETFAMDPCIPAGWGSYAIAWQHRSTHYLITVQNPNRLSRGVQSARLDDAPVDPAAIPLADDHRIHHVRVVLGPRL
jgi:cellobiose phosphorylase